MNRNIDLGIFISRVAIGFTMLVYGVNKLVHGIGFITGMMRDLGLPSFLSYGVYLGEIVAPILIIIGFRTRVAGLVFALNCLAAIVLAQRDNLFRINDFGGWALELLVIYMLMGVCYWFTGAGKYAVSTSNKWD